MKKADWIEVVEAAGDELRNTIWYVAKGVFLFVTVLLLGLIAVGLLR